MPDGTRLFGTGEGLLLGIAARTRVLTNHGLCAVENIQNGDVIECLGTGPASITEVERIVHRATGAQAPILVRAGAIGNARDLILAPDQLVLLGPKSIPAAALLALGLAERAFGGMATYFRLIFDDDMVIEAEGAAIIMMPPTRIRECHPGAKASPAVRHFSAQRDVRR